MIQVSIACLGVFVGLLLGFGVAQTKVTIRVALSLIGAALGGAPLAFLKFSSVPVSSNAIWWYPLGLLIGFLIAVVRLLDPTSIAQSDWGLVKQINLDTYEIFYKRPFAQTPNLRIQGARQWGSRGRYYIESTIVDQRPEGFKLKVSACHSGAVLRWDAVGLRKT